MSKKRHIATDQRSFEEIINSLPNRKEWAEVVFSRLSRIVKLSDNAKVLDVGAGTGEFLIACSQLGYECEGIEPSAKARNKAMALSEHMGIPIRVVYGAAESIPYETDKFDVVHASQVIEHVADVERSS